MLSIKYMWLPLHLKRKNQDANIPWIFIYKRIYIFKQLPQIKDIMSEHQVLKLNVAPPPGPASSYCSNDLYCTDWND